MSKLVKYIQQEKAKIKPPHILIVENDPSLARLINEHLQNIYMITIVPDGRSAIEACQDIPPNLIIIDTSITDMTALDLFQNLYTVKIIHRVPIMFLVHTGHSHSDRMAALEAGVDDYISKPFDIMELQLRIRNNLPHPTQSVDMITGLPGWMAVEKEIGQRLVTPHWSMSLFMLEHLHPYEMQYGLIAANNVRRAFANLVMDVVDEIGAFDDFIGTIGESAIVQTATHDCHEEIAYRLRREFRALLKQWYPSTVLAQGFAQMPDGRRAKLLTLSTTAVSSKMKPFEDSLDVIATAEDLRNKRQLVAE